MRVAAKGVSRKGTPYVIRYPEPKDAKSVLRYINTLSKERTFILMQGEQMTLTEEKEFIVKQTKALKAKTGFALFLFVNGEVAGVSNVRTRARVQNHVAELGLSIASHIRGEGLGEKLLSTLLSETKKNLPCVRIMTLGAMKKNMIARKLYTKLGFKQYGALPKATRHRGAYVDELFMYKPVRK